MSREQWQAVMELTAPEFHTFLLEHRVLAERMEAVRRDRSPELYRLALGELGREIDHHFVHEEKFVLPKVEPYFPSAVAGPAVKLRSEHDLIRRRHREVVAGMDPRAGIGDVAGPWGDAVRLLAYLVLRHIEKEDHYFFPMISRILTPEERAEVAEALARANRKMEKAP
ncbi:Hemerythrin HHE cation binding domain protein [Kyrpidia tusciae DSM 2912]|uniref:Hemerythrin HHE cation binding domain protein n=2 Tax=Kyrpidia TaxID=1129704 RepID=D5WTI7_KYRT2|nr:Hemerythrin HHE cation binding domain protein [Kyrpidia tusciae DSM 2912]